MLTALVGTLVASHTDASTRSARTAAVRRCAEGHRIGGAAADLVTRRAPLAVVMNDFYDALHAGRWRTQYPRDVIEHALEP